MNELELENNIDLVQYDSGEWCGAAALRVNAVPDVKAGGADEKYAEQEAIMADYLHSIHDILRLPFCVELLLTVYRGGNNTESKVTPYLIYRVTSNSKNEVELGVRTLAETGIQLLEEGDYEYEMVSIKNDRVYTDSISQLKDKTIYCMLKDEGISPSYTPVTEYYYKSEILHNGGNGLKDVMRVLAECHEAAVSISFYPTWFDDDEAVAVNKVTYLLDRISKGFYDSYYGEIRDVMALEPYQYYQYYLNNSSSLFAENIAVLGTPNEAGRLYSTLEQSVVNGKSGDKKIVVRRMSLNNTGINYNNYFYTFPWTISNEALGKENSLSFWKKKDAPTSLRRMRFIFSADEVSKMFRVPMAVDGQISGIHVRRYKQNEVLFADGIINNSDNLQFGCLADAEGSQKIGISRDDLTEHLFVTGVPGCGKTVFSQNLLYQLYKSDIPFLIIEPAKSEYRAMLEIIPDMQVFTPGNAAVSPFPVNPFIPPKNVTVETYKADLLSAFEAAFDIEGPLKSIFIEAIDECYMEYGWRDDFTIDDGGEIFGLNEFIKCFARIMETKNYSSDVKRTIETAGLVRLKGLISTNASVFDVQNTVPVEDLLNSPTLIELNAIGNEERKSFIVSLLLINIFAYVRNNIKEENYGMLNRVILLEEAHVLLGEGSSVSDSYAKSLAVKLFNRILAEMRACGVGMIVADQSPQKVTPDVIRNTASKMIFRTVDGDDRNILMNTVNMTPEESSAMGLLHTGEAYAYFKGLDKAVPVRTENFREDMGINGTVSDDDVRKNNRYWKDHPDIMRPFMECVYNKYCRSGCEYHIRAEAKYLVNYLSKRYGVGNDFTRQNFVDITRHLNDDIKTYMSRKIADSDRERVARCVKIEFLRMLYLNTGLPLAPHQRIKLLQNKHY